MTRSVRPRSLRDCLLAFAAAGSLIAGTAFAQEQTADGRTVYAAGWFAQFAPSNAWDMASRVPGVSVENGEDVRGFAGAAGNVVINGERPSAKAESLQSILSRIPAAQVRRVEIVPGQVIGGEYRSRAQVINIVLVEDASGWSGSAEATVRYPYSGQTAGSGAVSALYRKGAHSLNLAASHYSEHLPDQGYDLLTALPSGALIERREKDNHYFPRENSVSASWGWEPSTGTAAHLNGRAWTWENPLEHESVVTNPTDGDRFDTINSAPARKGFELGGDISRPWGGGAAKLVGLVRREAFENAETSLTHTPAHVLNGGVAQGIDNTYGESVLRGTWSRDNLNGWSVETGAEIAFNSLDSNVDFYFVDAAAAREHVTASSALVEELRGEVFVSAGRSISPTLTFDWGLAIETSTLTVDGANRTPSDPTDLPDPLLFRSERSLTFFKPRTSLEWRPNADWRLRAAAGRTVAQLNFDDFTSGAELANDRANAGNADLEPERTWRITGEIERKVLGDGALRLAVHSDWVEMVQDRIPIPVEVADGPDPDTDPDIVIVDGPGNLGDGRRIWMEAVAGLPLDRFGVKGGRFNARWVLQHSSVRDPYTLTDREFTFEEPWNFSTDFRQDLRAHNLAWGVVYDAEGALPQYRINEVDYYNPENTWFRVFVEARPNAQTTITLSANNVLDRALERDRTFYSPNRSSPNPVAHEYRWRRQGTIWALQVKRTFG